jgi:hypothetical protein
MEKQNYCISSMARTTMKSPWKLKNEPWIGGKNLPKMKMHRSNEQNPRRNNVF